MPDPSSRPRSVALIGCGRIAKMHASALRGAGMEIVAFVDRDEQKAAQAAAGVPGARAFDDAGTMLEQARPDAVHILTPPAGHAELAIQAAEAGCHVLVEKPMALDVAEADRMIEAALGHGVTLTPNHNYLSKPSVLKALGLVRSGAIGDVVHVESFYGLSAEGNSFGGGGGGGAHWAYRLPGGVFTNFLPHLVYLQAAFMGAIEKVAGVTTGGSPGSAEPSELAVLVRGAAATGLMTVSIRTRPYAKFVRVYGTNGIVHADLVGEVTSVHRQRRLPRLFTKALFNLEAIPQLAAGTVVNSAKVVTGSMRNMPDLHTFIDELYRAIGDGVPAPAVAEDGRMVVEVMQRVWDRMPVPAASPAQAPGPVAAPDPRTAVERRIAEDGALRRRTVLVTGAAGFLGLHVTRALVRCGAHVRTLVRDPTRVPRDVERDTEVVSANLVDEDAVRASVAGAELVVHCAAVTTNRVAWSVHEQTNVGGTRAVIDACRAAGVSRLIHVSSVVVYGLDGSGNGAVTERTPFPAEVDRWAYYQRSKTEADRMAAEAGATGELEVVVLRPGILYGPGKEGALKGGLVQLGSTRLIVGGGRNILPLLYVGNAVDAILLALTTPAAAGQAYNLVDEPQVPIRDAAREAAAAAGEPVRLVGVPSAALGALAGRLEARCERDGGDGTPRISRFQLASATRDVRYDAGKARRELGWEPAVDRGEALRRTFGSD
ncbi:MAG: NAD-dependent epimerase/dehydratase family protein [Solirubrobacteraceae bacterium]